LTQGWVEPCHAQVGTEEKQHRNSANAASSSSANKMARTP